MEGGGKGGEGEDAGAKTNEKTAKQYTNTHLHSRRRGAKTPRHALDGWRVGAMLHIHQKEKRGYPYLPHDSPQNR
jgi:hypothetical protein